MCRIRWKYPNNSKRYGLYQESIRWHKNFRKMILDCDIKFLRFHVIVRKMRSLNHWNSSHGHLYKHLADITKLPISLQKAKNFDRNSQAIWASERLLARGRVPGSCAGGRGRRLRRSPTTKLGWSTDCSQSVDDASVWIGELERETGGCRGDSEREGEETKASEETRRMKPPLEPEPWTRD